MTNAISLSSRGTEVPSGALNIQPEANFLADAEYSGQAKEGLDSNASYHRLVYLDRNRIFSLPDLFDLAGDLYQQFQQSGQSRMVLRVLADPSLTSRQLAGLNTILPFPEIDFYPDSQGRFNYLTLSVNRSDRAIDDRDYYGIAREVRTRVRRVELERTSFAEEALQNLERAGQQGFRPTLSIGAAELTQIWEPFGWSRSAVESLLSRESNDIVMGIRDRVGQLMAVALYNDQSHHGIRNGETTEWTTVPEFRGKGVIQPLLITLHSYLLSRGIGNIWADLRTPDPSVRLPNSIEPGLCSGMAIFHAVDHRYVSSNHVAIEGEAQSYNRFSRQTWGDLPRNQLRSFVRGWVDGNQFSDRLIATANHNLTLPQ